MPRQLKVRQLGAKAPILSRRPRLHSCREVWWRPLSSQNT